MSSWTASRPCACSLALSVSVAAIVLTMICPSVASAQCAGGGCSMVGKPDGGGGARGWPTPPNSYHLLSLAGPGGSSNATGNAGVTGLTPLTGGSGDTEDDCDDGPPDHSGGCVKGDPVVLPFREFVLVETDLSIVERGVRFLIRRAHIGGEPYDENGPTAPRAHNQLFGAAWNSTLQMYSHWGVTYGDDPERCDDPNYLRQRVNLGGYYVHDLVNDPCCAADPGRPDDPNFPPDPLSPGEYGCFKGPGKSLDWFRFASYTNDYGRGGICDNFCIWNPGVFLTREGTRYYFDYCTDPNESAYCDPNDPSTYYHDSFIQLLRRKENRYGQGYDYYYDEMGSCGNGDHQYRLRKVRTPSGRHLLFDYNDESWPNHVTNVHLADQEESLVFPNIVEYTYHGPNEPNQPGQLASVRRGCDCAGGGRSVRQYEYQVDLQGNYILTKIMDANSTAIVENSANALDQITSQVIAEDPNLTWTYGLTLSEGMLMNEVEAPDGSVSKYYFEYALKDPLDYPLNKVVSTAPGATPILWQGYQFNGWGGVTGVTRPDDANEVYTYDDHGRRTETVVQDANGVSYSSGRATYSEFEEFSQITQRLPDPNEPNIAWTYEYDDWGNLTTMTGPMVTQGIRGDPCAPVDTYVYAFHGDPNHLADPCYAFDPNYSNDANYPGNWGLPSMHVNPSGVETYFEYDEFGHMTSKTIVDPNGSELEHQYIRDPYGLGKLWEYIDPNGVSTKYYYDNNGIGKVIRIEQPEGQEKHFEYYESTGELWKEYVIFDGSSYDPNTHDPNDPNVARMTVYERDEILGLVRSMTTTGQGTYSYGYDSMGRIVQVTTPRGLVIDRQFDGLGRLESVTETEPGGGPLTVVSYDEYDPMGRVTQMTRYSGDSGDPNNVHVYQYAYNAMGWLLTRTEPDGTEFHTDYDGTGRVTRTYVEDANGICSETVYGLDELGRVWRQRDKIDPGGANDDDDDRIVETYRRLDGQVVEVKSDPNQATLYDYDGCGRLVRTQLPDGTVIDLELNDRGDVTQRDTTYADGCAQRITYSYESGTGLLASMTVAGDPNDANCVAETTSYTHYPTGLVETKTDPNGTVTSYEYDASGKVTAMVEDDGGEERTTEYVYDAYGSLYQFIGWNDGEAQITTYDANDARGQVVGIEYPNGDKIEMTYDLMGRLLTRSVVGGVTGSYTYDARGLLAARTSGTILDEYGYDALGRMTSAARKVSGNPVSSASFAYDALGRMTHEAPFADLEAAIVYAYDQADRRVSMTLPLDGEVITYTYEPNSHRVGSILRDDVTLVEYAYEGPAVASRRTIVGSDPNVYVDWTIERDGHLRMMGSTNTRVSDTDPNHVVLAAFAYQRRTLGLPTRETLTRFDDADPNGATRTFEYDRLYRLTGVDYPQGPNEAFAYDQAGNRITYQDRLGQTTTYDPNYTNLANQYGKISPGVSDPNYDAAGNMTSDHRGYEYVYDGDNRLWRVWKDDVLLVQYIKDALGRRIRKEDFIRGTTTRYLWSGQNVVAEYDDEYERLRYYVHGPTYIDERVVMHDEATDRDYVYLMKDLYTVAGLADRQGWPVESYDYDAYGRVWMRRCAVLPWAADLDGDGDVDASDHAIFEEHYAGSGEEPNGVAGWRSDLDCDGDVDGSDYVWFAHAYNGDGQAPRGDLSLLTASTAESQVGNAYFFTGRRLDVLDINDANTPHHFTDDQPNLTLYYYRARTMEPVLGRFGQRDPLDYVDGMDLYEYGRSVPSRALDPSGQFFRDFNPNCPTPPPITGNRWNFSGHPAGNMHRLLFAFYFAPTSMLRFPPRSSDSVIIGGSFLNDVRGQSQVRLYHRGVDMGLELDARKALGTMKCDETGAFLDCSSKVVTSDLASWHVVNSLGSFTLYWTAMCRIGPKRCCVRDSSCASGFADKAYYHCVTMWTVYDRYDWVGTNNIARFIGVPFRIYGYYTDNSSGTVRKCR